MGLRTPVKALLPAQRGCLSLEIQGLPGLRRLAVEVLDTHEDTGGQEAGAVFGPLIPNYHTHIIT